jgi:hypothetical protein
LGILIVSSKVSIGGDNTRIRINAKAEAFISKAKGNVFPKPLKSVSEAVAV